MALGGICRGVALFTFARLRNNSSGRWRLFSTSSNVGRYLPGQHEHAYLVLTPEVSKDRARGRFSRNVMNDFRLISLSRVRAWRSVERTFVFANDAAFV
jgi:hypothetical protein